MTNADANDRSVAPVSPPDDTSQVVTLPPGQKWATVEEGRYAVQLAPSLTYEVDVPDRWRVYEGRFFNTPPSGANSIFFVSAAPADSTELPQHPSDDPTGTRVGSSVSDLAHALRRQPVLEVSRPDPVTVNGNDGLYVEVRIPETVDSTTCIDDTVALFSTPSDNWGWTEGLVRQWWILNVDGERVVVNGSATQLAPTTTSTPSPRWPSRSPSPVPDDTTQWPTTVGGEP